MQQLERAANLFDNLETCFVRRVYESTGFPVRGPMEQTVRLYGGTYESVPGEGFFDRFTLPYPNLLSDPSDGSLTIARPWLDLMTLTRRGHIVTYEGSHADEKEIVGFLRGFHQSYRTLQRQTFIEVSQRFDPITRLILGQALF